MPGLYNITSNANVSVGDTIGLYQQSGGNVYILNNAQQLLNTLSQNGNVNFALDPAYANTRVLAFTANIGTTAGTFGNTTTIPVVTVGADGRITSIIEVAAQGGTYGNANVAAYLPTYTGTLDNSSTIIALVANAGTQATSINTLFSNAAVQSIDISTLFANAATQATSINTLTANAATQSVAIASLNANVTAANLHIQTIDANLGAFEAYANATFSTSTYSNTNVAAYLTTATIDTTGNITAVNLISNNFLYPNGVSILTGIGGTYSNANVAAYLLTNTGDIQAGNITVQGTLFSNDITAAAVLVDGDTTITGNLLVLGNTTTINSNVITTNDKTITVANNISNSTLLDGAGLDAGQTAIATWRFNNATTSWQSNIAITPASNAISNLGGTANYWNNVYAVKLFGDGSALTNLPVQTGTYSDTNVAAYLSSNTDPTISNLNANAAVQAVQIDALNANLGAFETYANATFGSGSYGNANVAAYLPTYGGNIGNASTTGTRYINSGPTYIWATAATAGGGTIQLATGNSTVATGSQTETGLVTISSRTVNITGNLDQNLGGVNITGNTFLIGSNSGTDNGNLVSILLANTLISSQGTSLQGKGNYGGYLFVTNSITAGDSVTATANLIANNGVYSTAGYFWANGTAYSTGSGTYGNTEVAAFMPVYAGNFGNVTQTTGARNIYSGNINLFSNTNSALAGNISLFAGNASSASYGAINLNSTVIRLGEQTGVAYPNLSEIRVFAPMSVYPGANTGNIASFYQGNVRISSLVNDATPGATNNGGYLYVGNTITTGSILSSSGYFWANGVAYSTGGGGGSNFTSNLTVNSNYIVDAILDTTREKTSNIGVIQGTVAIDANLGGIQTATVTANITINTNNLTNFNTGESVTLVLTQNTNANLRLLTSNLKYAGGSKILSSANAAIDTISITYDGTNYLASLVKGYA